MELNRDLCILLDVKMTAIEWMSQLDYIEIDNERTRSVQIFYNRPIFVNKNNVENQFKLEDTNRNIREYRYRIEEIEHIFPLLKSHRSIFQTISI